MQTLAVCLRGPVPRQPRNAMALMLTLAQSVASSHLHGPIMAVMVALAAIDFWPDAHVTIASADLTLYVLGWSASAIAGARGIMRTRARPKSLHLFGMVLYWPLQSLAGIKALYQFVTAPHRWDKTPHAPRSGSHSGPHESGRLGP